MGGIWPSSYEELLTNNIHIMHPCSWIHTHATAKKPMQCARLLGHIRNINIECTYIITHTCGITHCCLSSPILTGRYMHNRKLAAPKAPHKTGRAGTANKPRIGEQSQRWIPHHDQPTLASRLADKHHRTILLQDACYSLLKNGRSSHWAA